MGKVRKGRKVDKALCKKGFCREEDGDHICYEFPNSDVRTKISHGMMGEDIGRELLGKMAGQVHLDFTQFLELVDCQLDKASYRAILVSQGEIVQ